jgi:hypothetical protein
VTGSACVNGKCGAVANLPNLQSDIQAEQSKLNNDISFVQFYPVISVSFGYKF